MLMLMRGGRPCPSRPRLELCRVPAWYDSLAQATGSVVWYVCWDAAAGVGGRALSRCGLPSTVG